MGILVANDFRDNRSMHLIIPYASSTSEGCHAALARLKLPHLQKLLARSTPLTTDVGDEHTLTPPHEHALARALGLPTDDGLAPWASLRARERNLPFSDSGWAFATLCHWQVNTNHMVVSHLPVPNLNAAESDDLLSMVRPYFEEDGLTLYPDEPGRWLAQADVFAHLPTAAPDRVLCRNLDDWMPASRAAAPLRRLQNEMQMLLYTHPQHDARSAKGQVTANSFWISGTGVLPAGYTPPASDAQPTVVDTLRTPALAEQWSDWAAAWQSIDAEQLQPLLARKEPIQITLCGERSSQTWQTGHATALRRFMHLFGSQPLSNLLEKL